MDSEDKFILILDRISEVSEKQVRIETKMEGVQEELKNIATQDEKQNQLLAEHIQGTIANTKRLNLEIEARAVLESRVNKLEKVPQFMGSLYKILVYLGAVVGLVYEFGRILHKW